MSEKAWEAREKAFIYGNTKVGCCILSENPDVFYTGCNIEHMFRSHDVHAEVNAISNMVASGSRIIKAVLVVAERDNFTPCGSCMDWIMQFANDDCVVGFQKTENSEIQVYKASELMPYYPH